MLTLSVRAFHLATSTATRMNCTISVSDKTRLLPNYAVSTHVHNIFCWKSVVPGHEKC